MNNGLQNYVRCLPRLTPSCRNSVVASIGKACTRLLRTEAGGALVETAMCISLMCAPLLIGTLEAGVALYDSIEVSNAAHAGTAYGMMSSTFAASSSGMIAAAQGEAPDLGSLLSVTPTTYFACSQAIGGTQYTSQTAANSACTGSSNHSLEFVQVITSAAVPMPFTVPGLPSKFNLTATSVMEVEE
jgi:Flp pilus assembly protein TadG